jgi:ComF family protein
MGRSFDAGISCCDYSGRASDMVRAMKYRESSWIAGGIAEAMRDRWEQLRGASMLPCPDVSLATHVPMSEQKKRRRGYDQAELIARRLARLAGVPYMADVLVRKRDTAVMSGLGAQGRRANMSGAFAVSAYARSLISGGELPVENVLLIDDVFTTGSSADACAAELKEAGAQTVTLFTFASGADWS